MAEKRVSRLGRFKAAASGLFTEEGLIRHYDAPLPYWRRIVQFLVLVIRRFVRDRCPVRASALAYTTLLALIPLLTVILSITTSVLKDKGEEQFEELIDTFVRKVAFQLDLAPAGEENVGGPTNLPVAREWKNLNMIDQTTGLSLSPSAGGTTFSSNTNFISLNPAESKEYSTNVNLVYAQPSHATAHHWRKSEEVARQIHGYIKNVRSFTLGTTGVIGLLFVGISLLSTIESVFNDIWGAARNRSWVKRVVQYWAAITLGPILFVLVLGLKSVSVLKKIPFLSSPLHFLQSNAALEQLLSGTVATILLALLFTLLYQLIPNTKVHFRAALLGGVAAAILFQLNGRLNVVYVSQVVRTNQVYGSLGVVPIFLVGMYLAWLIVLFGAEVAYAFQHKAAFIQEKRAERVNARGREYVAVRVMTELSSKYHLGEPPPGIEAMAHGISAPAHLVEKVMGPLLEKKLVVETAGSHTGYVPGRPLDQISCMDVIEALRTAGGADIATRDDRFADLVRQEINKIQQAEKSVASRLSFLDLVAKTKQLPEGEPKSKML
jgi:membrane protein